ncbi:thermonuclease family protein [Paenalcaligenes sp. Me52]|uniref:thermonuclease family protein n=1 Tax=Paenalcaligenes sp. Me52 TaxID=3392038 RepID=UPI003D2A04E5
MKQQRIKAKKTGLSAAVIVALIMLSWLWEQWLPDSVEPSSPAASGESQVLEGRVVRVADGDTLTVQVGSQQYRIRLASIDAPETHKSDEQPGQPYAQASRDFLYQRVGGKNVQLNCYEEDNYGRKICDVSLLGQDTSLNRQLVAAGYAWANQEKRGRFLRDKNMVDLQQQAQKNKQGIWQAPSAVEPWVWRYQCWQQRKCD